MGNTVSLSLNEEVECYTISIHTGANFSVLSQASFEVRYP